MDGIVTIADVVCFLESKPDAGFARALQDSICQLEPGLRGRLIYAIRAALTGTGVGRSVFKEIMPTLGRAETIRRLRRAGGDEA